MTHNIDWLKDRIRGVGAPLVIDGGMGTLLQHSGVPMHGKVWSGQAVLSHPEAVIQAHEAFIKAGAEAIITNTFATARHMLEPGGLGKQVREINLKAVELAQQARDNVTTKPLAIVGSICEWTPSDNPKWHTASAVGESVREQANLLAEAGVDLIALEMCQQIELSIAAIEAALEAGLPVWIGVSAQSNEGSNSLSVFDYADRDFETLVKALAGYPAMMINIMHTPIIDIDSAFEVLRRYWSGPIGIYPESGYFTMPDWNFVDIIEPEILAEIAQGWVDKGVRMVGGCCGLGPEHIAVLRQALNPLN